MTQPLLRGAGYKVAFESLTQAERELLYTLRDFELFRESFVIDVISSYYNLVSQKQQVDNTNRSVVGQKFVADRADAFYKVDRLTKIEKLRADQAYLSSKNRLIDAEQSYRLSLDRFKVSLGLPTETEFDIPDDAQPAFVPVNLDLEAAVQTALHNRLDLLTQKDRVEDSERQLEIAKNRMLPDLSLTGSYVLASDATPSFGGLAFRDDTYTVGLNLEIPLNRKAERNAYRAAMISADQAHRSLRQTEDDLILEVRDSLRRLKQQEQSIDIQKQIVETETTSVRIAEIEYQAGEKSTRDVTEARERLLNAQNSLIEAIVAYEIARLNLLRQLGILFVDEEGMIVK
ncbi:MAG: TolC family protein [Planctomycetes bacterium]|nr:TolC family protein [Planctomycetota bacterium]